MLFFALTDTVLISCKQEKIAPQNKSLSSENSQNSVANKISHNIQATGDYIILSASEKSLPENMQAEIAKLGGTVKRKLDKIGLAIVQADKADFISRASQIKGIKSVIHDLSTNWLPPDENDSKVAGLTPHTPSDFFYPLQWNVLAIHANDAWSKGYKGKGAVVAVLDEGFYLNHHDLAPNIDLSISTSMVAGWPLQFQLAGEFSHGTHIAGIVAAPENNYGTVGVAPKAKLMLVRVLTDTGSASFGDVVAGIYWAATHGANVINMSFGTYLPHHLQLIIGGKHINMTKELQELLVAFNRSTIYAHQRGAVIVCAAGNDHLDLDHIADVDPYPAGCVYALSVSATSPKGWAIDMSTNLDIPATYTNYGTSGIDFAAPGGDIYPDVPGNCNVPPVSGIPCNVYDLVLSPAGIDSNGDYWAWLGGTSMASAHVTGVAALIAAKHPGYSPTQIEAALRISSDDLGKPGRDDFFGHGRVNASKAVDE